MNNKEINVCYCAGGNIEGIFTSIISLVKFNKQKINVYLITMDLSDKNKKWTPITEQDILMCENILKSVNPESSCKLIDVTQNYLKDLENSKNADAVYTPFTMLRFYIPDIPSVPDKILYFDTDLIILDNVQELYDTDISKYELAGCKDYLGRIFIRYNYINAGMLLLNIKKINETNLFKRAKILCNEKKMTFVDQDAIDRCLKYKLILPDKYNHQRTIRKNTVIRHYCKSLRLLPYFHTINIKPWQTEAIRNSKSKAFYNNDIEEIMSTYEKIRKHT